MRPKSLLEAPGCASSCLPEVAACSQNCCRRQGSCPVVADGEAEAPRHSPMPTHVGSTNKQAFKWHRKRKKNTSCVRCSPDNAGHAAAAPDCAPRPA